MPNTKSAKASLKKSLKRRERNRGRRSIMRTYIANTLKSVDGGNLESAESNMQLAIKMIDKNVKWNQLHQNTAARKKSILARAVNGIR
ncbi:MAG: 30S ribosomal protein S20 [Planctomycetes bacterium]|jgi:small subunit ribosomal protein S20|nr:30S ribosomal protein S20 [Planctomycetota bacterium]MDA9860339.1 30S ribosomal protein S20 [Planctomycetota bacterium]|tara:strand:- start:26 stop:289 length:264 start_codon:yes stop_codon:yes gene_type:complete